MFQTNIKPGEVTSIDVQRGCFDMGLSIVGGIDTPLVSYLSYYSWALVGRSWSFYAMDTGGLLKAAKSGWDSVINFRLLLELQCQT